MDTPPLHRLAVLGGNLSRNGQSEFTMTFKADEGADRTSATTVEITVTG